jgi:hypothetical protein
MNAHPFPSSQRSYPTPLPPKEDALTKYGPFLVLVPIFLMVAAIVVPAAVVAAIAAVIGSLLRLRWWMLLLMGALALVTVLVLDLSPSGRVEKAMNRVKGTWMDPKADSSTGLEIGKRANKRKKGQDMFEKLEKRLPRLAVETLPASIPLGFVLAAGFMFVSQRNREPLGPTSDPQRARRTISARMRAKRRVKVVPESIRGRAVLGPAIEGDLPREWLASRPFGGSFVVVNEPNLGLHQVIIGQPGFGKTTTLTQLAYLAAKVYGWRVFFLDGKGDYPTRRQFVATMLQAGFDEQQIGSFPTEPFDGWRTSGSLDDGFTQLLSRLLGVIRFTEPYYEDATRAFVSQALLLDGSLPESSEEFLERLDALIKASAVELRREAIAARMRYQGFFDSFRGKLDGSWSFADKRAAYVLIDGMEKETEAPPLAAYFFECFKNFAAHGKHPNDRVLLIVDEFPAVAKHADVAGLVERLRSFGCSVALTAQSYEGLGDQASRILSAARLVIAHGSPRAEEIVRLAGTVDSYSVTSQVDHSWGPTGRGSVTPEQQFRVDPNLLGSLDRGEGFLIAQRRAHLFRVAQRPLPEQFLWRADEILRPKVQVERLSAGPPHQRARTLGKAIDW